MYRNGPCRSYTFSQRNAHYRNDSIVRRSVWHEAVKFPDVFIIEFGEKGAGNKAVFRNDSMYRYKDRKQVAAARDTNTLLLLLGGMYYREVDDVIARLGKAEYNLMKSAIIMWEGKQVFVVGASGESEKANQVWFDTGDFRVLRIIERMNAAEWMDMRFDSHQKWCNGFVETKVSFRRNGKLEQVEEYYDLKQQGQ